MNWGDSLFDIRVGTLVQLELEMYIYDIISALDRGHFSGEYQFSEVN